MDKAREIKNRLNIEEVIHYYGLRPNMRGKYICPFHNDHAPSMSIKNGKFKCFVCDTGGDMIDFVAMYFNTTFQDAIKKLDCDFNLGLYKPLLKDELRKINRKRQLIEHIKTRRNNAYNKLNKAYDDYCRELRLCREIIKIIPVKDMDSMDISVVKAINRIPVLEYLIGELDKVI